MNEANLEPKSSRMDYFHKGPKSRGEYIDITAECFGVVEGSSRNSIWLSLPGTRGSRCSTGGDDP